MNTYIKVIVLVILQLGIYSTTLKSEIKTFTATDMHKLNRISNVVLSDDSLYAAYIDTVWDEKLGIKTSNIKSTLISDPTIVQDVTTSTNNSTDSNPVFSGNFSGNIIYLHTENGTTSLYSAIFPHHEFPTQPTMIKQYPIDISNLYLRDNLLLFSAEVYVDCDTLQCTADKNTEVNKRGSNTWREYTKLMVRHWDMWYTEGKATHVFLQKLKQGEEGIEVDGDPIDLLKGKYMTSPPLENGPEEFAISGDEAYIAFSALARDENEAINASWDIYLYNTNDQTIINLTEGDDYKGRCQKPRFSPDKKKLSFFCMERPYMELDQAYVIVYDIASKTYTKSSAQKKFNPTINEYDWKDDTHFWLNTLDEGRSILYLFDYTATDNAYVKITNDMNGYSGVPLLTTTSDIYIIPYSSFTTATLISKLDYTDKTTYAKSSILTDLNIDTMKNFEMITPESFNFKSQNGDTVQGWICKPTGFVEGKKYPVAVLLHGGPENAWEPSWSYRWNPQLWLNDAYAVVMINHHGSAGMGIAFQDEIRGDFGGLAYQDIMDGIDYVIKTYNYVDGTKMGACGASYGGYMANWIQGNTDRFKALVTHDGDLNEVTMFYATDELFYPLTDNCPVSEQGCTPYTNSKSREYYEKWSPESKANNWKTPHLVIHGSQDFRIPVTEGISTFTILQLKGIPSRFIHFPDECHWVQKPENSIYWYQEVLGWLDKYVKN